MPTRPPSRELNYDLLPFERHLSIEETYNLANTARRKSASEATRNDLRLLVGHTIVLDLVLDAIAKSPPPSPSGEAPKSDAAKQHIIWAPLEVSKTSRHADAEPEYSDEDGEEDLASLSLVRTPSRRPQR